MKLSDISNKILPFDSSQFTKISIKDHKLSFPTNELKSVLVGIENFLKKENIPSNAKITNIKNNEMFVSYKRLENYHEYASRIFNAHHEYMNEYVLSYNIKLSIDTDEDFLVSGLNLSKSTLINLSFDNKLSAIDFINSMETHNLNDRHMIPACEHMNNFKKLALQAIDQDEYFSCGGNWEYSFSCTSN